MYSRDDSLSPKCTEGRFPTWIFKGILLAVRRCLFSYYSLWIEKGSEGNDDEGILDDGGAEGKGGTEGKRENSGNPYERYEEEEERSQLMSSRQ